MLRKLGLLLTMVSVLAVGGSALAQAHPFTGGRHPARAISGVVNINTATSAQLEMLPGVGRQTAGLILAYREKQPFKTSEDIVKIKGVGPRTYSRIKTNLAVSGPTTLAFAASAKSPAPSTAAAKATPAKQVN